MKMIDNITQSALEQKFLAIMKDVPKEENKCWEWPKPKLRNGYGHVFALKATEYAHRIAYKIFIGKIANSLCVLHRCDNRKCVNPHHLFLGTKSENSLDMFKKGRNARGNQNGSRLHPYCLSRGEDHFKAKLKESDIKEIRILHPFVPKKQIAEAFCVSESTIYRIINRKNWTHI